MNYLTLLFLALWSLALRPAAQLAPAQLRPEQATYQIAPGTETTVVILLENATDVYGIDVRASYDPARIELIDADPTRDGVQVAPGQFPQPDFVAVNMANPQTGALQYVVTQLNPTPAASGSGVLFTVRLRGRGIGGTSEFRIEQVEMSSRDGMLLPVQWSAATLVSDRSGTEAPPAEPTGLVLLPTAPAGSAPAATESTTATAVAVQPPLPTVTPQAAIPAGQPAVPEPAAIVPAAAPESAATIAAATRVGPEGTAAPTLPPDDEASAMEPSEPPAPGGQAMDSSVQPDAEDELDTGALAAAAVDPEVAPATAVPVIGQNSRPAADSSPQATETENAPGLPSLWLPALVLGVAIAIGAWLFMSRRSN